MFGLGIFLFLEHIASCVHFATRLCIGFCWPKTTKAAGRRDLERQSSPVASQVPAIVLPAAVIRHLSYLCFGVVALSCRNCAGSHAEYFRSFFQADYAPNV